MENVGRKNNDRRKLYTPDDLQVVKEFFNEKDMNDFFEKGGN